MVVLEVVGWMVGELGKGGQRFKHPAIRWISHGDVMYDMVTIVNTVLCI